MKLQFQMMAALLLTGSIVAGQEAWQPVFKKSLLAFYVGPGFPVGDFGQKDMNHSNAGLAKPGCEVTLYYGYRMQHGLGVAAKAFYSNFNCDVSQLEQSLMLETGAEEAVGANWTYAGVMLGPTFTVGPGKRFNLEMRLMGGVANTTMGYYHRIPASEFDFSGEESATSFAMHAGFALHYALNEKVFMSLGTGWTHMKPEFGRTSYFYVGIPEAEPLIQPIDVINLHIGAGYRF